MEANNRWTVQAHRAVVGVVASSNRRSFWILNVLKEAERPSCWPPVTGRQSGRQWAMVVG